MPSEKAQVSEEVREFVRQQFRYIAEILSKDCGMNIGQIRELLKEVLTVSI